MTTLRDESTWLDLFHAGQRSVIEQCYRENYEMVTRAIGRLLEDPDKETVIHEVFLRVLTKPELRRNFRGGSVGAWLARLAINQAYDFRRRARRDVATSLESAAPLDSPPMALERRAEARLMVERFRREILPAKWDRVFEARFLRQLDQRAAAEELGMNRTTLAYQDLRIRRLLRRFVLWGSGP